MSLLLKRLHRQNRILSLPAAAVENVKLDYKDGETPRTTATAATTDRDKRRYSLRVLEEAGKNRHDYTSKSVAYWYSDEELLDGEVMQISAPLIRMASMKIPYDSKAKTDTSSVTAFELMILHSTAKVCPKAPLRGSWCWMMEKPA